MTDGESFEIDRDFEYNGVLYQFCMRDNQNYNNLWEVGPHTGSLTIGGVTCSFGVNVIDDPAASQFAHRLANRLGSSVVIKGQAKPQLKSRRDKLVTLKEAMSPEEFLGYIKYARCIVANSFHAIALSIVFQKECYALKSRRSGRVEGLLSSLGLADRIVAATEPVEIISSIDYKAVNERLALMRQSSTQFITSQTA